jgi:hypothetical protein
VTAPTREEVARGLIDRFNDDPSDGLDNSFGQAMRRCADYVLGLIRDEREACAAAVNARLYSSDNRVTQAFGRPWIEDAVHAIRSRGAS